MIRSRLLVVSGIILLIVAGTLLWLYMTMPKPGIVI